MLIYKVYKVSTKNYICIHSCFLSTLPAVSSHATLFTEKRAFIYYASHKSRKHILNSSHVSSCLVNDSHSAQQLWKSPPLDILTFCLRLYSWGTCKPYVASFPLAGRAALGWGSGLPGWPAGPVLLPAGALHPASSGPWGAAGLTNTETDTL